MYKCLKNVLVSSSALLLAVSLGAGLNNVNVNARRVHSHRVIHHKRHIYNHRMNEYSKGKRAGRHVMMSNNPDESGMTVAFGDSVYNFKYTLYQNHLNKQFIKGVYKELNTYKHKKDEKDFYKMSIKEVRNDINTDRRLLKHFHHPSKITKLAIDLAFKEYGGNFNTMKESNELFHNHRHNKHVRNTWIKVDRLINHLSYKNALDDWND